MKITLELNKGIATQFLLDLVRSGELQLSPAINAEIIALNLVAKIQQLPKSLLYEIIKHTVVLHYQTHTIDVRVRSELGEGGFAAVDGVSLSRDRNCFFAIKKIKSSMNLEQVRALNSEAAILAQLQHQTLIQFKAVGKSFATPVLITKHYPLGNLSWLISSGYFHDDYKSALIPRLGQDIVEGIAYLHHRGYLHGDIKPDNILLAESSNGYLPKICDFGLSKAINKNGYTHTQHKIFGTTHYLAPELARRKYSKTQRTIRYHTSADIFALAMLLFLLHTKTTLRDYQLPYSKREICTRRANQHYRLPIKEIACQTLQFVISQSWAAEPSQRLSASAILALLKDEVTLEYMRSQGHNDTQCYQSIEYIDGLENTDALCLYITSRVYNITVQSLTSDLATIVHDNVAPLTSTSTSSI
jgi:serine/threonine protein kinase